jgi:hypothetical protein
MVLFLAVELVNIIRENRANREDDFSFVGSIYTLHSLQPTKLENFYKTHFNFYDVADNRDDLISIGYDTALLKLDSGKTEHPQQLIFRTEKISHLFSKLIGLHVKFKERMHLDENDNMRFSIFDPDSNVITCVGL